MVRHTASSKLNVSVVLGLIVVFMAGCVTLPTSREQASSVLRDRVQRTAESFASLVSTFEEPVALSREQMLLVVGQVAFDEAGEALSFSPPGRQVAYGSSIDAGAVVIDVLVHGTGYVHQGLNSNQSSIVGCAALRADLSTRQVSVSDLACPESLASWVEGIDTASVAAIMGEEWVDGVSW